MFKTEVNFQTIHPTDLGQRILVMGPSNSGKSTLAVALSEKLELPTIHMDHLRFKPNTDWEFRSDDEFASLHSHEMSKNRWIIEGNYTDLLPPRLERATGVILLHSNAELRFLRYLNRTLFQRNQRAGNLEGAPNKLSWQMTDWILLKTRKSSFRYARLIEKSKTPFVFCRTAQQLNQLYATWNIELPQE